MTTSIKSLPPGRCSPLRSVCAANPTTQPRPTTAKAPIRRRLRKSNHAGSLSAFAHNQPGPSNPTSTALRFAPFAQPAQFHPTIPPIPPSPTPRKCSAEYSPALAHLNPTARPTSKPLNSARPSLHSLHFVTLSFRSVGKRC